MHRRVWVFSLLIIHWAVNVAAEDDLFEKQIRPLLVNRCYQCHSGEKSSGGLSLDTAAGWKKGGESGPAIIPGKPDESLLIQAVNYQSLEMPPVDAGGKLAESEIAALTKWIQLGAEDPRKETAKLGGMNEGQARSWWAFQPLIAGKAITTSQQIDDLIATQHEARSLTANRQADRRTLIRRATYDLTGLPPTIQEVEQFLADESANAFANVIERLLASPQYGVKWGRHWLDVVRYADTAGENTDRPLPHAWRYRNWVFDSFNRDLPYDQFVKMQLAGDILQSEGSADQRSEEIVATGYLAIARRFGHDIDKDIHLMHEDVIDNLGKNLLGLSIGCARCHDHKYDPITAKDYYALYGIFSSTRFAFPGCEPQGQPRDLVPLIPQADVDQQMNAWRIRNEKAKAEKKRIVESLAAARAGLQEAMTKSTRLLAMSNVAEGESVSFVDSKTESLDHLAVRQGEILQLTVFPNGSHGADSTLVDWEIAEVDGEKRTWNVADVIPTLLDGNPHDAGDGASWCFLEIDSEGPKFLSEKRDGIDGQADLSAWRQGDTSSVFVNRASDPIEVWTSLPAESFFVHPGINRPVSVAWVCDRDTVVSISGRVMDAHPAGGDGVAFQLQHIASVDVGSALIQLGRSSNAAAIVEEPAPSIPVAYAVVEAEPQDARLHLRGDPEKLGDPVQRRWLSVFGGDSIPQGAGSGRRQLGDWIVQQPLTARVMVNRIWQWHFGRGLVATPNDFGSRGQPPTHPRLLDSLAAQFQTSGYSVKAMHRLIMNSAAYQRGSDVSDELAKSDGDNRWLTRFTRQRLEAEEIRDSLLLASGNLDTTAALGHPFPAQETWKFTQHDPFVAVYENNKRSAYLMVQRQRRHPYLAVFDGADPNASTAVRQMTTVPTQALYFLNSPFFHQQAEGFAKRAPNVDQAFGLLFQRQPSKIERDHAAKFLQQYPGSTDEKWAAYARVLMASNEFVYLD